MWFWREVTAWKSTPKNGGEGGRSQREGEETTRAEKQREDQREKKTGDHPPAFFDSFSEITRRLIINAVRSPKENQDIQTAASMQQLAANLDSANSKESEKVSEGITLTKFLDCLKLFFT